MGRPAMKTLVLLLCAWVLWVNEVGAQERGWLSIVPPIDEDLEAYMYAIVESSGSVNPELLDRLHPNVTPKQKIAMAEMVRAAKNEAELLMILAGAAIRHDAPLREWRNVKAFDTAKECEQSLQIFRRRKDSFLKEAAPKLGEPSVQAKIAGWASALSARCVPAESFLQLQR